MNWRPRSSRTLAEKTRAEKTRAEKTRLAEAGPPPGGLARRVIPALFGGVLLLVGAQIVPGCSTAVPTAATGTNTQPGVVTDSGTSAKLCDHPNPGCPCSEANEKAACGKVILKSGSFFQCEEGTVTCNGTTWGPCDGDIVTSAKSISGGGFKLQSLGKSMTCGAVNPCDPYCYVTTDTGPGVDGGPGLASTDAGLSVALPTNLNTCNEPAQPATVFGNLTAPYSGTPTAACTSGVSDNCNSDYVCTAGTCAAYADGVTNTTGACMGAPDFTAGVGCFDSATASGLELQVCNRGGVTAGTGNLVVALVSSGAPTFAAGTCPAGSRVATGPAVGTTGAASGTCSIPLGTVPIGAGECISFNVNAPPAGIACTAASGVGAIAPPSSQLFAVVNPPASIVAGNVPLAECDACNNYTAVNASSGDLPTGSPVSGPSACTSSWCGVTANSTGGNSCSASSPTRITGNVTDPGGNVSLSNVAVYVATATPGAIQDEPGGATTPTCDSCASLSTAGYLSGVNTDVNGNFTLYVNPGTYTVVAQLGRWRRVVSNVSASVCANTVIPPDSIRMPKNQMEGDIPKMAIVEGNQESLECWLAKVGISASEIAPYAAGATNRIQLYESANGPGENYWDGSMTVTPPSATTLWDTTLNDYSAVLIPCDGSKDYSGSNATTAEKTTMTAYANAGGRVFMDHWPGETWVENNTNGNWNASGVATWSNNSNTPSTQEGNVFPGTAPVQADQAAMYAWMSVWDNTPDGAGNMQSQTPRDIVTAVGTESVELVKFPTDGNAVASFWFNTPTTASAGSYCGRVVYNDMHVSGSRGGTSSSGSTQAASFPGSCATTALTSEELALEYEMFQLSACGLGSGAYVPPPPPPPPPPLGSVTFTRDFQANCSPGFTPRWGFFEWEASIPTGTNIVFTAQTAMDGMSGQPGTYGTSVAVATATVSSTTMFMKSPAAVDTDLTTAGQTSQDWLRVSMTFNPNGTNTSPDLTQWQQLYDCVP
jgi:hypothetical protein